MPASRLVHAVHALYVSMAMMNVFQLMDLVCCQDGWNAHILIPSWPVLARTSIFLFPALLYIHSMPLSVRNYMHTHTRLYPLVSQGSLDSWPGRRA